MLAYHASDPETCANTELGKVWKLVWPYLESSDVATREGAVESLDMLSRCITPALMKSAIKDTSQNSVLQKIIVQTSSSLDSLSFARSMTQLLSVISSLIVSLRYRPTRTSTSAAEALLGPLIQKIGDLRVQKGFENKEDADMVLSTAMRILGPHVLLHLLPLNLEPADRWVFTFSRENLYYAHITG